MPTPAPANAAPSTITPLQRFALVALQFGAAGWIGYGAFMKAVEFNPLLLPPPIMAGLRWFMESTSVDATAFLEWSLRAIIGVEIFIALAILATRWARAVAIATLSLFCVILMIAMVQAGLKDGLKEALAGSCGCFGKAGLPASVMFLVDAALLALAWIAPASSLRSRVPIAIPAVIGLVAVFAVPKPEVTTGDPAAPGQTAGSPQQPDTPATSGPSAGAVSGPWPSAPTQYEKNYFTKWPEWVGKPIRSQKIALAIERPLPEDFERGDWIVIFSRQDCEVCQRVYRQHFAAPRKERVLKVAIHDTTEKPLAMPCEGCVTTSLFRVRAGQQGKTPTYLIQTPVLLRLKDGIVTAVCNDADNAEQLASVVSPAESRPAVEPPSTPVATKPAWPGIPTKLEPFYIAEYKDSIGQPFSSNTFSRLITGEIPADFLSGRWIVIFYREDCEHCHDLLMTYFTGKLPVRTLAVAIPDTDPSGHLENPCEECVQRSLVKGPNFVIGTPVILAIQDGVVECVVEDANDIAAVEACLKFPRSG